MERERLMAEGRAAFNRGEYYEAHEFWEEVWDEADDPDRTFIQGLIQIATGLHKVSREQIAPARTLLGKGLAKLASAPADFSGFDVATLRTEAQAALVALGRNELPDPLRVRLRKASGAD